MELAPSQTIFGKNIGKLLTFIDSKGYLVRIDEVYRPEEMAKIYAAKGIGIPNSLHTLHLAMDFTLYTKDFQPFIKSDDYKFAGDYWESLNPLNRWGGNFHDVNGKPRPDGNHVSMKISLSDPRS